jgi:hypothetical protein
METQHIYILSQVTISLIFFIGSTALVGPGCFFQSPDLFTIDRAPWTSDQLIARSLPKHRTAQTHNKHIYTPNINALSGIRIHNHSDRASEDSSCLGLLGYRDQHISNYALKIKKK